MSVLGADHALETEDADETILQGAPEALDTSFGLRASGGDIANAECAEDASSLGGFTLSGEFFLEAPALVVAYEDAGAIPVEHRGDAVETDQLHNRTA